MAKDTRKDPRAKVLTMTVRYKSATLDEFIEHHSYDISRGGMFIKTPSPFPPGTLLKFEVKIADDHRLMQGVGRVVWKRETADAKPDQPAGMGVKFIKIDEDSKRVIDRLVGNRGDIAGAYDQGATAAGVPVSQPPPGESTGRPGDVARREPAKTTATAHAAPHPAPEASGGAASSGTPRRKATMIGLGSLIAQGTPGAGGSAPPAAPHHPPPEPFFPVGAADLPPPEDRTVMKQAAELLQDALRQAGGSMDEVGMPSSETTKSAPPPVPFDEEPTRQRLDVRELLGIEVTSKSGGAASSSGEAPDRETEPASEPAARPGPLPAAGAPPPDGEGSATETTVRRPAAQRAERSEKVAAAVAADPVRAQRGEPATRAQREDAPARARVAAATPAQAAPQKSGGGRAAALLFGVAAAGGLVWFVTRQKPVEPVPPGEPVVMPATQAEPAPALEPTPDPQPAALDADASVEAADGGAVAADAGATAAEAPPATPSTPAVTPPAAAAPPVVAPRPTPAPAPRPKPKPKPEPAEQTPSSSTQQPAATPEPAPTPAAPTAAPSPAPKPAEPAPAEPAPKPKPSPKPEQSSSDNPY